jgi:hypothetical protein
MSLIPDRYECSQCGGYDLPRGARRGLRSECRCGSSIYDGEQFREPVESGGK